MTDPWDDPELDALVDRVANSDDTIDHRDAFVVDDDRADWALRRLARLDTERARVQALYDRRRDALDDWLAGEAARDRKAREWLLSQLAQFHRAVLARDQRAKTVRLPSGRLSSTAGQARFEVDDDTFTAWAVACGREDVLRRPDPRPDRNAIKRAFRVKDGRAVTDDGEVVPGVAVLPAERTFTATPYETEEGS